MKGRFSPGGKGIDPFLNPLLQGLAQFYHFDLDLPFARLPKSIQHLLLYGSDGEKNPFRVKGKARNHLFRQAFEGVIPELERKFRGG